MILNILIPEQNLLEGGSGSGRFVASVGSAQYGQVTFDSSSRNVLYTLPEVDVYGYGYGQYPDQDTFSYRVENACGSYSESYVTIDIDQKYDACSEVHIYTLNPMSPNVYVEYDTLSEGVFNIVTLEYPPKNGDVEMLEQGILYIPHPVANNEYVKDNFLFRLSTSESDYYRLTPVYIRDKD